MFCHWYALRASLDQERGDGNVASLPKKQISNILEEKCTYLD
jgi:hypothetical protein